MNGLNEPQNIIGMGSLLADDSGSMNIDELEESIIKGVELRKNKNLDFSAEFNREIDQISKDLDFNEFTGETKKEDDLDELLKWGRDSPRESRGTNENYRAPTDSPREFGGAESFQGADMPDRGERGDRNDRMDDMGFSNTHSSWSISNPSDRHLSSMSNEERKQIHIGKVMKNISRSEMEEDELIKQEEEEDEMARIMEQIDLLRSNLEGNGIDISRIPEVNASTPKKEVKSIMKILQIKYDRVRYCDMFDEAILAISYGLESAFDGKREWFGYKPDLVGLADSIKIKLRRLRVDTSTFVSDIMRGYNISSSWRIILELLPTVVLYSRERRIKRGDNLIDDQRYKEALNQMHNT